MKRRDFVRTLAVTTATLPLLKLVPSAKGAVAAGFNFVDDCNHDIDGVFAKTFEREVETVFPGNKGLHKLPNNHQIYHSFFEFPDGPPNTTHELNGWGDDIVHDYLQAVEVRGRVGL